MADPYIKGADILVDERIAYADANGLSRRVGAAYRVPDAPWRKVWHTMEAPEDNPDTIPDEGWELPQLREYIIRHRTPPHLWAAPHHDWVGQTVPLDLSAYALRHESGDPETNHMHAIQTEVIGFAADGPLRGEIADWLGRRVLGPIVDAGVPINVRLVAPSTGSDGAGEDGLVRMSWAAWETFNGQCGHANVPGNSHWDPGLADYLRIAAAIQEDDMPYTQDQLLAIVERGVWNAVAKGGSAEASFEKRVEEAVEAALQVKDNKPGLAVDQMHARVRDGVKLALDDLEVQSKLRTVLGLAGEVPPAG